MEMEPRSPDSDLQIDKLIAELVALDDPKSSDKYTVLSHEIKGRRSLNLEGALKEYHGTAKSKALAIILEMVDCSSLLSLSLDRNGLRPADMMTLTRVPEFPELQTLRLDDNELGDDGVKALAMSLGKGWVPSLQELRISRCRVGSAGFTDLGNAFGTGNVSRSLKVLDLGGNKYTSARDGHGAMTEAMSSGYLPALEELCLGDCALQSIGLKQYADAISKDHEGKLALPALKIIDFSANNWFGSDNSVRFLAKAWSRGKANALREINFSYNDIGDLDLELDPFVHSSITQLRKLVLRGLKLTDKGLLSIAKWVSEGFLKSLEVLDVSSNRYSCVRHLCTSLESGKSTHLRELLLGNTEILDEDLMAIARAVGSGHLKALEVLDVSRNYCTDDGLLALATSSESGQLSHLRKLDLSGHATEGAGVLAVARAFESGHLKSLQVLKIFNTSPSRANGKSVFKITRTIFWQLNKQLTLLGNFKLRKDISGMGFKLEEAYNARLVLCLYDVDMFSEIVQIVFLHVEGMASLLGIGLPFSRVSIGSELKIVVEDMSEDDYVSLWMDDHNSFKPMVFERVVENPSAISSGTLDLSTTEALSKFGVGADGRNHFIRQNAKIESESNIVNFGVSWLTESWFNQVLEKRRLEEEVEEKRRLQKKEKQKQRLRKKEEEENERLPKKTAAKRRLQIAFEKEEEEEEKQRLPLKIELAEEEEEFEKHRLAWKARIAWRTVGTDPFQSTMQSPLECQPAIEERVTAERRATTEPATEKRVAERMAITERKSTTSAHGERLAGEKQDHEGKQLVGAHEGGVAPQKQEKKEKELGGAHGEAIVPEKKEHRKQVDAPDGDSRSTRTVGGWSFWPQRKPTTKESMGDVTTRSAEKLGMSSTSQDARVAEAPEEKVSNLADDKMLSVVVEMSHLDCQLYDHDLSRLVTDTCTYREDPVLSKCFIKPRMIIEFISSPIVRVGDCPIWSNSVTVRFEVDYQIDGNIKDSKKFGWYQDNLCLSFKCEDSRASRLTGEGVIGSKLWEVKDSTMIRKSQSLSKVSNEKCRVIGGPRDIFQGEAQVGNQRDSMHGSTDVKQKGAKYEIECLEKASSFAITSRSVGNEMAYKAQLRRDIAPLQEYKLWDEEERKRAEAEIAGMFSSVRIDVKGTWRLLGNENKVHVFAAGKHLLQHTKEENVQEATVSKTFLQRLKIRRSLPVVSPIGSTLQTLEQKISKKFLLNHSFSHLNNIEVLKKDTPYEWVLVEREESPVRELINLPPSASGLV